MNNALRPIDSLTVADCEQHGVWEFGDASAPDETWVKPVKRVPVDNLTGRVVATQVTLANGQTRWARLANLDLDKPELNQHFLSLVVEQGGQWFPLARYFDFFYGSWGPQQLAGFLGLNVDDVFPITFDVSAVVRGNTAATVGKILAEPEVRLNDAEIMALAVG